jgi:hypothetical protein
MSSISGFSLDKEVFKTLYVKFFNKSITDDELKQFKNILFNAIRIAVSNNQLEEAEKLNSILNIVEMKLQGLINLKDLNFKLANLD